MGLLAIPHGRKIGIHTLRHSYARHPVMNGIHTNYLSSWPEHSTIQSQPGPISTK